AEDVLERDGGAIQWSQRLPGAIAPLGRTGGVERLVARHRQVGAHLAVERADARQVFLGDGDRRELALREAGRKLVDRGRCHISSIFGTRKYSPLRSGALASASSCGRHGRFSSSRMTLTMGTACEVGSTPAVSRARSASM